MTPRAYLRSLTSIHSTHCSITRDWGVVIGRPGLPGRSHFFDGSNSNTTSFTRNVRSFSSLRPIIWSSRTFNAHPGIPVCPITTPQSLVLMFEKCDRQAMPRKTSFCPEKQALPSRIPAFPQLVLLESNRLQGIGG